MAPACSPSAYIELYSTGTLDVRTENTDELQVDRALCGYIHRRSVFQRHAPLKLNGSVGSLKFAGLQGQNRVCIIDANRAIVRYLHLLILGRKSRNHNLS